MNENLNLVEILKDCPKETKLYSTAHGEVKFIGIVENAPYPIIVKANDENFKSFTADGKIYKDSDGECLLFPSRTQRNWAEFKPKQPKFDPKTLQPYDKVLVRNRHTSCWRYSFFSHKNEDTEPNTYKYVTSYNSYKYCIPYNDDTKHLVGTIDEAPEYYRYWREYINN